MDTYTATYIMEKSNDCQILKLKKRIDAMKRKIQIKLINITANAISEKYSFFVSKEIIQYTNPLKRGNIRKPQSTINEFISVEKIK